MQCQTCRSDQASLLCAAHDAPNTGSYRDQKSAQSKGKSTKGRGEVDLGRPIGGQDQLAEQLMAAAGFGTAAEDMACSAEAVEASSSSGGAPRPLGMLLCPNWIAPIITPAGEWILRPYSRSLID